MRLTKYEPNNMSMFPYKPKDEELSTELDIVHKLGRLEDIEEEVGFEKSGSSLLAFLQTPYIKSIMKLYVSARKELENETSAR